MKDRRLTQKQIERLLANNPTRITMEQPAPQPVVQQCVSFKGAPKEYDTLGSIEHVRTFCSFIRDVVSRYEENQRLQEEAETMETDLEHCIELAQKLTEREKKVLYAKLTDVLQTRRACKCENEILQPLYAYFSDRSLLNTMSQLQGSVSKNKEIVENRAYTCRTNVLDDFRTSATGV